MIIFHRGLKYTIYLAGLHSLQSRWSEITRSLTGDVTGRTQGVQLDGVPSSEGSILGTSGHHPGPHLPNL